MKPVVRFVAEDGTFDVDLKTALKTGELVPQIDGNITFAWPGGEIKASVSGRARAKVETGNGPVYGLGFDRDLYGLLFDCMAYSSGRKNLGTFPAGRDVG